VKLLNHLSTSKVTGQHSECRIIKPKKTCNSVHAPPRKENPGGE